MAFDCALEEVINELTAVVTRSCPPPESLPHDFFICPTLLVHQPEPIRRRGPSYHAVNPVVAQPREECDGPATAPAEDANAARIGFRSGGYRRGKQREQVVGRAIPRVGSVTLREEGVSPESYDLSAIPGGEIDISAAIFSENFGSREASRYCRGKKLGLTPLASSTIGQQPGVAPSGTRIAPT